MRVVALVRLSFPDSIVLYSQLHLALARDKTRYGTIGTSRKFWSMRREEDLDSTIRQLLAKRFDQKDINKLLSGPFKDIRYEYLSVLEKGREIYEQDRALYALCRPERLLELAYKFILFDNGIKKIARYQQYLQSMI